MPKNRFLHLNLASTAMVLAGFSIQPTLAQNTCQGVQFGAFGKGVIFSVALREGFFTREGINVCYQQVTGSVQQFDTLESGGYDLISTAADNVVNRVVNLNKAIEMIAGTDLGPGFALGANTANGIHSIADLKGKPLAVDAPDSGFVFALRRILKANGLVLENGDYSLQVIGGGFQRYQALAAGTVTLTPGGQPEPVYATLLGPPFTQQAASSPNLTVLANFSDYLAPYQSGTIATTVNYIQTHGDTLVAFLRALINAGLFVRAPENRARVVADYAAENAISSDLAAAIVADDLNPVSGESPIALMNRQGLINTIQLRAEFGGFTNPNINPIYMAQPGNGYYDDRFWLAAMESLFAAPQM